MTLGVVSKLWAKETSVELREWEQFCRVVQTDVDVNAQNQPAHDTSLDILRSRMAEDAHAFVAVGGEWWSEQPGRAGVPREFDLARERGMPCFLVGGFGGKSAGYLREHPQALESLENGLSAEENRELVMCEYPGLVTGAVVAQLCALFSRAAKDASAVPAHALYVELATRITTQRLHYRSGDEETAARSLASLFDTARKLMAANPDARTFHEIALALLNDTVRPYTARWHGWMTQDGDKVDKDGKPILKLRDEWVRRKFRCCGSADARSKVPRRRPVEQPAADERVERDRRLRVVRPAISAAAHRSTPSPSTATAAARSRVPAGIPASRSSSTAATPSEVTPSTCATSRRSASGAGWHLADQLGHEQRVAGVVAWQASTNDCRRRGRAWP